MILFSRRIILRFFVCVLIVFTGLVFTSSLKADELGEYCADIYEKEEECPKDKCMQTCYAGILFDGCDIGCFPKSCLELSVDDCPEDSCQIMDGCSGKKVCYYKVQPAGGCGGLAYTGQDVQCCEGMVKRCGVEFFDGTCDMKGSNSVDSVAACLPCGNGICNQFENSCNCPEDCNNR